MKSSGLGGKGIHLPKICLKNGSTASVGDKIALVGVVGFAFGLPVKLTIMHIACFVALFGVLLTSHRRSWWLTWPVFWLGMLFAVWQILSVLASPYEDSMRRWGMAYTWLIVVPVVQTIRDWSRFKLVAIAGLCGLAFSSLVGLAQFVIGLDTSVKPLRISSEGTRFDYVVGVYGQGLTYGFVMGLVSFWVGMLSLFYRGGTSVRMLAGLLCLLSLSASLLAKRRSSMLGLVCGVFGASVVRGRRGFFIGCALVVVLAGLGIGALALWAPEKIRWTLDGQDGRWAIWRGTYHMIGDHMVFGVGGAEAFPELHTEYQRKYVPDSPVEFDKEGWDGAPHAHNSYLSIAAEHGIPCVVFYLIFLASMVVGVFKSKHVLARSLAFGTLAYALSAGMFENFAGDSEAAYALYFGLAIALVTARIDEGDKQEALPQGQGAEPAG